MRSSPCSPRTPRSGSRWWWPATGELIAYAVPTGVRDEEAEQAHVGEWRELHEDVFTGAADGGLEENFAGWNSSYDGSPIPLHEMREWHAATIDRITALSTEAGASRSVSAAA